MKKKIWLNLVVASFMLFALIHSHSSRIQEIISIGYFIYLIATNKLRINKKIFLFITYIIIVSIIKIYVNNYQFKVFYQQIIILSLTLVVFYNFFKEYNVIEIFQRYLLFSKILSIFGLFQIIIYAINGNNIFYFVFRGTSKISTSLISVTGGYGEPGMYAQIMLPSVIFILEKTINTKRISIMEIWVIASYLLTGTSIAILGLIIYGSVKLWYILNRNIVKGIFFLPVTLISIILIIRNLPEHISNKFFETLNGILNPTILNLKNMNASSFAFVSNLQAAILSENYFFGTGIGTVGQNYYKYFKNYEYELYGLNFNDGYSVFIRLLSELGIFGIILISLNIFNNSFYNKKFNYESMINLSVLVGIISYFIRDGSYYLKGIIPFYMFLVFTKKKINNLKI